MVAVDREAGVAEVAGGKVVGVVGRGGVGVEQQRRGLGGVGAFAGAGPSPPAGRSPAIRRSCPCPCPCRCSSRPRARASPGWRPWWELSGVSQPRAGRCTLVEAAGAVGAGVGVVVGARRDGCLGDDVRDRPARRGGWLSAATAAAAAPSASAAITATIRPVERHGERSRAPGAAAPHCRHHSCPGSIGAPQFGHGWPTGAPAGPPPGPAGVAARSSSACLRLALRGRGLLVNERGHMGKLYPRDGSRKPMEGADESKRDRMRGGGRSSARRPGGPSAAAG